jgi:hypothetical protein
MRFQTEVSVVFRQTVDGKTAEEACERAHRMACARPGLRAEDILGVLAFPLSTEAAASEVNLRMWQESEALRLGTQSQRQRWGVGCLPDEELLFISRNTLFLAFALIPRRSKMGPGAIAHPVDPDGRWTCHRPGGIPVAWSTTPSPMPLSGAEWRIVTRIHSAMEETRRHPWLRGSPSTAVRVSVRAHRGTCEICGADVHENAALVEIDWAGRTLSREYSLV